jgi:hypothetical protein
MAFDVGRAVREAARRRPPGGYPKLIGVMPSVRDMPSTREILLEQVNEKRRMWGGAGGINPFDVGETPAWKRVMQAYQRNAIFSAGPYSPFGSPAYAGLSTGFPSGGYSWMWKAARPSGVAGLHGSIAGSFAAMNLTSDSAANWYLKRVRVENDAALRSLLRSVKTFRPIVVSPEQEAEASDFYPPDLQGWLIPETATRRSEDTDLKERQVAAYANALGVAIHHHSDVFLRAVGPDGRSFLIQVAATLTAGVILYWLLPG